MLRQATDDDWAAIVGRSAPGQWFGIVSDRGHFLEGIGAVYADRTGRWWITFERAPGVRKVKTAHAAAKRLLAQAQERGVSVYALASPGIPGAEMWIERLGFVRSGEDREGHPVWVLR